MRSLIRLYRLANLLSLDVALGALVSALFFARLFSVRLLPWGCAALGLSVWIIYTVDHLLDARSVKVPASSVRHRFHQEHFKIILIVLISSVFADLVCISMLRKPVFEAGIGLGSLTLLYLVIQRYLKSFKEMSGAALYCAGVVLPALSLTTMKVTTFQMVLMAEFGITVLCNLLLFALFGLTDDREDRHESFVTVAGEKRTRMLLKILFAVNTILLTYQLFNFEQSMYALVIVIMNLVLCSIFVFQEFFKSNSVYRLAGDAIFFIPVFLLATGNR